MFHNGRVVRVTMTQKPRASPAPLSRAPHSPRLSVSNPATSRPRSRLNSPPLEFPIHRSAQNRAVLPKSRMNMRALAHLASPHGTMAYLLRALWARTRLRPRHGSWGTIEDPATGSAGGSLGAYLVHHGQMKPTETLVITQGVEMGRPSEIQVEITEERGKLHPQSKRLSSPHLRRPHRGLISSPNAAPQ